jgi:hypothetical protein
MNSNGKIMKPTMMNTAPSFWDTVSDNAALFMFVVLLGIMFAGVVLTAFFQSGPTVRNNLFFNSAGAIGMGFMFIYIIFKFMGAKISLFGVKIDMGLTIYMLIVLFVIFVLGG